MDTVRIDKWLWAARFFKTRSLAKEAASTGRIKFEGVSVKPSFQVRVDQALSIRKHQQVFDIIVLQVSDKRGSAHIAQQLYQETQQSLDKRERARLAQQAEPKFADKPDKKQRRQIRSFRYDNEL